MRDAARPIKLEHNSAAPGGMGRELAFDADPLLWRASMRDMSAARRSVGLCEQPVGEATEPARSPLSWMALASGRPTSKTQPVLPKKSGLLRRAYDRPLQAQSKVLIHPEAVPAIQI